MLKVVIKHLHVTLNLRPGPLQGCPETRVEAGG